ncbi:YbdD/YjiX family protein [Microbacterium sp. ZW T5_45]|uniref:YbdD/YjiX family protein n=1 Tax=Microbacterium sp. ZW T5_45 TaxID=3378080 RepID=UPI0038531818
MATIDRTDAVATPLRALLGAAARVGRGIRWYVTTLMGDRAYDTYIAHLARAHPDAQPMTERQFWRQRMDDQDRNPGARCC